MSNFVHLTWSDKWTPVLFGSTKSTCAVRGVNAKLNGPEGKKLMLRDCDDYTLMQLLSRDDELSILQRVYDSDKSINDSQTQDSIRELAEHDSEDENSVTSQLVIEAATIMFFDSSRQSVLGQIWSILCDLFHNKSVGQKKCFIIVGQRGIGKSSFLASIATAAQLAANHRDLICWVSFKGLGRWGTQSNQVNADTWTPLAYIKEQIAAQNMPKLTEQANKMEDIEDMNKFLLARNMHVVLFLDEVEQLYIDGNADAIHEFHNIGQIPGSRSIVVIMTGSAPELRRLAFRKLSRSEWQNWPNYQHMNDLNSEKFIPLYLFPLRNQTDFARAACCLKCCNMLDNSWELFSQPKDNGNVSGDELMDDLSTQMSALSTTNDNGQSEAMHEAFHISRGHIRELVSKRHNVSVFNLVHRRILDNNGTVYNVLKKLCNRLYESQNAPLTQQLEDTIVENYYATNIELGEEDQMTLYCLHDKGALIFDDRDYAGHVRFYHPCDVSVVRAQILFESQSEPNSLTVKEIWSLLSPDQTGAADVNERLVFESLHENAPQVKEMCNAQLHDILTWKGAPLESILIPHSAEAGRRSGGGEAFKNRFGTDASKLHTFADIPNSESLERILGFLAKELPDVQGADGVALCRRSGELCFDLLRVQVKLGWQRKSSNVTKPEVMRWCESIQNGSENIASQLKESLKSVLGEEPEIYCHNVIWCSQGLTKPAKEYISTLAQSKCIYFISPDETWWCSRIASYLSSIQCADDYAHGVKCQPLEL